MKDDRSTGRKTLENSVEPLLILASEGTILDLSPAAEAILETRRESLVGRKAQDLVEHTDLHHARRKLQAAVNRRDRELKGAIRLKGKKGTDAWVQVKVELPPASEANREYIVALRKFDVQWGGAK